LKSGEEEIKERIVKTDQEKTFLQTTTQDEENKVIDAETFEQLDLIVRDLYSVALGSKFETKMGNANTLQLLNEIEKEIDQYIAYFNKQDKQDPVNVQKESKAICQEVRKRLREDKMRREKIENEEKQRKKQEEKNAKNFIKVGKPSMYRSEKKKAKKEKKEKKKLTDEQLDYKKYLQI